MKIIIINEYNPYFVSSASANRWCSLINGLLEINVKCQIVVTGNLSAEDEILYARKIETELLTFKYLSNKIDSNIWKRRFDHYFFQGLRKNNLIRKIVGELRDDPHAIIWTSSSYLSFQLADRLRKRLPRNLIVTEMSEFLDIYKTSKHGKLQLIEAKKRESFFETKALYAYHGLALMTKTLIDHYSSFKGPLPKMEHIPMTVDLNRFKTKVERPSYILEKKYIAFIGLMNNRKDGVDILIKAYKKISEYIKDINLVLVGPETYDTASHKSLLQSLDIENRVQYLGPKQKEEIPGIIQNATLLALPRPPSKQAEGGFPTKLGEYLASGVPVCATKVGEIPDYLEDEYSVFFAEPGSIESFANAMQRALSNPEKATMIGKNGQKVAEKSFNSSVQTKKLYRFFLGLLENNKEVDSK